MKKKSLALIAIAVMMVASIATAATLAFFTDSQSKDNTFTVGDVKIKLTEEKWIDNSKINPNQPVAKNPVVEKVGQNDAYARIKVTVNKADVFGTGEQAIKTAVANIFSTGVNGAAGSIGADWSIPTSTYDDTKKTVTLVYNYTKKLDATNTKTTELFQNVTLPATFGNIEMGNLQGFKITVLAQAIQADGFVDANAAFAKLTDEALAANH